MKKTNEVEELKYITRDKRGAFGEKINLRRERRKGKLMILRIFISTVKEEKLS